MANWDTWAKKDCTAPGKRQYSTVLRGIPWGQSWENTCASMPLPATIDNLPVDPQSTLTKCVNAGVNEWGQAEVLDPTCSPTFGNWDAKECVQNNQRKFSSHLIIPSGPGTDWWEKSCAATNPPSTINGLTTIPSSKNCVNNLGMYMEVNATDPGCSPAWGAFRSECTGPGQNKYFSKLDTKGMDWGTACAGMGPTVLPNGQSLNPSCVTKADGQYGEWLVSDASCTRATNADLTDLQTGTNAISSTLGSSIGNLFNGVSSSLSSTSYIAIFGVIAFMILLFMLKSSPIVKPPI